MLVASDMPSERDRSSHPQAAVGCQLLIGGEAVQELRYFQGWYGGFYHGGAILTNLKDVAWAMPTGIQVVVRFGDPFLYLAVLEGAFRFHTFQMLFPAGFFVIESDHPEEHFGHILNEATRPPKGTPNFLQRDLEWLHEQARPCARTFPRK